MELNRLRNICQPKNPERPWSLSEKITRYFSIYFTCIFIKLGITANAVSFLSVVVGYVGCYFIISDLYMGVLIGAIFLVIWDVLDCSDGEVARFNKQSSLTGLYVDRMAGLVVGVAQYIFIGFYVYNITNDIYAIIFGIVASISRPISTLSSSHMQVSALEAFLYNYKKEDKNIILEDNDTSFIPDLDFVGVKKHNLIMTTGWFFYKGIGKHFLFIISIFVDFFILDVSNMTTIYDSAIGIYLIIYGVFSPLAWGWMVYKIIKNKSTEAFYNKILSRSKIYSK